VSSRSTIALVPDPGATSGTSQGPDGGLGTVARPGPRDDGPPQPESAAIDTSTTARKVRDDVIIGKLRWNGGFKGVIFHGKVMSDRP